jgi:hypothetical protein
VRRLILLAALSLVVAACGSSAARTTPKPVAGTQIDFGVKGGNIAPFTVTIGADGRVSELGTLRITKHRLGGAAVCSLSGAVESGLPSLSSRQCKGTLPDVGSRFIRAKGKTVTVHGSCEPGFERLWSKLTAAVGFD